MSSVAAPTRLPTKDHLRSSSRGKNTSVNVPCGNSPLVVTCPRMSLAAATTLPNPAAHEIASPGSRRQQTDHRRSQQQKSTAPQLSQHRKATAQTERTHSPSILSQPGWFFGGSGGTENSGSVAVMPKRSCCGGGGGDSPWHGGASTAALLSGNPKRLGAQPAETLATMAHSQ